MFSFIGDVVEATVSSVTGVVESGFEFLEGLTEGEIRQKALLELGATAIEGLSISDIMRKLAENR